MYRTENFKCGKSRIPPLCRAETWWNPQVAAHASYHWKWNKRIFPKKSRWCTTNSSNQKQCGNSLRFLLILLLDPDCLHYLYFPTNAFWRVSVDSLWKPEAYPCVLSDPHVTNTHISSRLIVHHHRNHVRLGRPVVVKSDHSCRLNQYCWSVLLFMAS